MTAVTFVSNATQVTCENKKCGRDGGAVSPVELCVQIDRVCVLGVGCNGRRLIGKFEVLAINCPVVPGKIFHRVFGSGPTLAGIGLLRLVNVALDQVLSKSLSGLLGRRQVSGLNCLTQRLELLVGPGPPNGPAELEDKLASLPYACCAASRLPSFSASSN